MIDGLRPLAGREDFRAGAQLVPPSVVRENQPGPLKLAAPATSALISALSAPMHEAFALGFGKPKRVQTA